LCEAGIHDDKLAASIPRFHDPLHRNWMVRGRVRAHNEDYIGVTKIHPMVCHCTASERLCQSRNSCGVSYSGLMFYIDKTPRADKFLHKVAFLVVHRGAADMGDALGPVYNKILLHIDFRAVRFLIFDRRLRH